MSASRNRALASLVACMPASRESAVVELHHHALSAFCAFLVGISSSLQDRPAGRAEHVAVAMRNSAVADLAGSTGHRRRELGFHGTPPGKGQDASTAGRAQKLQALRLTTRRSIHHIEPSRLNRKV
jgi:hypothetical protein